MFKKTKYSTSGGEREKKEDLLSLALISCLLLNFSTGSIILLCPWLLIGGQVKKQNCTCCYKKSKRITVPVLLSDLLSTTAYQICCQPMSTATSNRLKHEKIHKIFTLLYSYRR
jgi:hypothetical protein